MPILHNVTFYVAPDQLAGLRSFYVDLLGAHVVFEQEGHICCVEAGDGVAICIHEAESGRPPGARELFFWVETVEPFREQARARGVQVTTAKVDGRDELRMADDHGNLVRLHVRRPAV